MDSARRLAKNEIGTIAPSAGVVLIKRLILLNQPPRRYAASTLDQGGEFARSDFMCKASPPALSLQDSRDSRCVVKVFSFATGPRAAPQNLWCRAEVDRYRVVGNPA